MNPTNWRGSGYSSENERWQWNLTLTRHEFIIVTLRRWEGKEPRNDAVVVDGCVSAEGIGIWDREIVEKMEVLLW